MGALALLDFRYLFAYRQYVMQQERQVGALLIAASIVAAIRLRGEPIRRGPRLTSVISESVELARLILRELER